MTFVRFAKYLQELEKTASRNEITRILANLFKDSTPSEIDKICYLVLGRIAPQYEGTEFNLAEKMVLRVLSRAYSEDLEKVVQQYKRLGDPGDLAFELATKSKKHKAEISVNNVFNRLKEIALESGEGSQERKLAAMSALFKEVDALSARYLARIPTGNLRLGFSDMTILDALSVMETGDKKARKVIEAAFNVTADIGKVAAKVRGEGLNGLKEVKAEPGIPIRGSLAERLASAEKIAEKMNGKFAVEPKIDGFRTQVHIWNPPAGGRQVRLFSRNLENVTAMFPEILVAAKEFPVESAIFDGEAIGYNPKTGKFAPFQETVQRKRKHGIAEKALELPLKVFVFDVLYLNAKTLLQEPFINRREILEKLFKKKMDTIALTDQEIVTNAARLRKLADGYLKAGLEGAMAKKLNVAYQAGGRGFHWVKYKKHSEALKGSELSDTIDCVLMGAYVGRGKRAQFGVGGFLIGVPGNDEKYYTLTNLGTGLTDEQFREMYKLVQRLEVETQPEEYVIDKQIAPDIWVKPEVVLEILADEITLSPRHTAGRSSDGRGYSLRFPRLMRVRRDKNPEQATSVHELKELYKMQKTN